MIFEVIYKEHVPENASVIAGTTDSIVSAPDGPIANIWSYLPKDENCQHICWPDSYKPMEDSPKVELNEALHLLELFEHTHGDQQSSNPKESVYCEICSGSQSGNAWSSQDVQALSPVLDVRESKPLIMAVDNPEYRKNPSSVKEEQVLVFVLFGYHYDFQQVVIEAEALYHSDWLSLAAGDLADERPQHPKSDQNQEKCNGQIVAPVHLRLILDWFVEMEVDEGRKGAVCGIFEGRVEIILNLRGIDVGSEVFLALNRRTQPYILYGLCQPIDYAQGEVNILVTMIQAVVIVSQVVEELSRVGVRDWGERFGSLHPGFYKGLAGLGLISSDSKKQDDQQQPECRHQINFISFILNLSMNLEEIPNQTLQNSTTKRQTAFYEELATKALLDLQSYPHLELFADTSYPWQALPKLPIYLKKIVQAIPQQQRNKGTCIGSVYIADDVVIGEGTVIEHGAMIKGPALIGKHCELRKGAYVRGNVIIGDGSVIGNSTEIKHSIIFQKAEICHFNYVGDSVVAQRAHMAAGAITSNLKLDCGPVNVKWEDNKIQTGMAKFGAILGQHCQIGCNAVLNPGTIIGKQSIVYPGVNFRGYLPKGHICKLVQTQKVVIKL